MFKSKTEICRKNAIKNFSRSKRLWLSLILSFICVALLCIAFLLPKSINKNTETASAATYSGATNIGDLYNYDAGCFEKDVLNTLAKKAGYDDIEAMVGAAEGAANSTTILKKSNNFSSVTLNFGRYYTATTPTKLEWIPVALSKGENEHAILTLWLSHTDIHGVFIKDCNSKNTNPPCNNYGTSYVRNVINNYGTGDRTFYYTGYGNNWSTAQTLSKAYYTPQTSNVVSSNLNSGALYYDLTTDSNLNFKNYIIAPNKIGWQKAESSYKNDPSNGASYYGSSINWNLWQSDLLWLPSVTEVGMGTGANLGLWATSQAMRKNSSNSTWTRSACNSSDAAEYHCTYALLASNGAKQDDPMAYRDYSVRPAFHLDLTEVAKAAKIKLTAPSGMVDPEYNGAEQSLATLLTKPAWYNGDVYGNTDMIAINDKFTDVSENEVTVTIVSGAYWSDFATNTSLSRTFKFKIKKKKLAVTFEDNDGRLTAKYDETQLYDRDKTEERKPKLKTKYSQTALLDDAVDSPTSLGTWYAIAVLENECNYYVEDKQAFTVSKQSVNCPTLSAGYDASAQYSGGEQSFVFDGFDSSVMSYTAPEGALSFDGTTLKAKDIKKYEIVYFLKDTSLYEWSDSSVLGKSVNVEITKKQLEVEFEDKNGCLVAKFKDENEIYSDDKNGSGKPKFTLVTKYSKNGSAENATYNSPDAAGVWYAHAFIEEDCNYTVSNAGESFTLNKIKLPYPSAADADALTPTFDGTEQSILLVDYVASAMSYAVPDGAQLDYNSISGELTVKVKNAGEYTVKFTLTKPALYEWLSEEPVKITVSPKKVQINSDEGNPTSWEKDGNTKELTFTVPTALCGEDTSLNLAAVCTKNGAEQKPAPAVVYADGKYTLTVPAYSRGNYSLVVKVADGENYSGASQPFEFEITGVGIDIGYNDIVWKIDGKNYTVADETEEVEIEYSGKNFTLTVDYSSNEYAAEIEIVGDIGGDWADAKDVGSYTANVRIASTNPELIFDKEFTLKIKIVPKELTFDDAIWQWQYEGDAEWQELTDKNMPQFDGKAVAVRLSPDYLSSLGLESSDYTLNYINSNNMTEKGDKTTFAEITVTNANFSAGVGGYVKITKNWKITAKALSYKWTATQIISAGGKDFEFPAVVFDDGGDYSAHFTYYFKVDGDEETEYTKEEIENYISEHWTETTAVTGSVYVKPVGDDGEVVIKETGCGFTTGTPKTALEVTVDCESGEYGKIDFSFAVVRGGTDEKAKTTVKISGPGIEGEKIFDGNSEELLMFINGLNAGSYDVVLSVNDENADSYTLVGKSSFTLEIAKRKVALPTLKDGVTYTGETIYFKDCLEGFDEETMKIIGADDNGIDSGKEWREGGYFTKIALKDSQNFEFAESDGASEHEYNWMINKFRITEDMWDKSGKDGAYLNLPDWVKGKLSDETKLKISYSYFNDENSDALEEVTLSDGSSYFVCASLSGADAANFEFENGTQVSAKTVYTVPEEGGISKFFGSVGKFVKDNTAIVIGVGVGLLLLILLIIILAARRKRAAYAGYGYDDEYDYDEEDGDGYDDDDDYDDDGYDGDEDYDDDVDGDDYDEEDGEADDSDEEY